MREMVPGDIIHAEYVLELLLKRVKAVSGVSYEQFIGDMPRAFHTGGVIRPPEPKPLPEGVVGYTVTGRPIYDGDWFDRQMSSPNSVTVYVEEKK